MILKGSPGDPRYDCTNCCFVTRGSYGRSRGKGQLPGVMNVGLFTVSPEGAGWANIYKCPFESDNDRKI